MPSKDEIEKMVKGSFAKGDADKDWGTEEDRQANIDKVSKEPDPADDLPPID